MATALKLRIARHLLLEKQMEALEAYPSVAAALVLW
jgi:hypothetical protein